MFRYLWRFSLRWKKNQNGHRYLWPLGRKRALPTKKHRDRFRIFRLFSLVFGRFWALFTRFRTFWVVCFCLFLAVRLPKNLLMPLFLMGCFPMDFQEVKRPLGTESVKRPIKVGKRPINEGKRPIKAMVLVGILVGCLMGCFRAAPPWRKTAPLKRPIKRSMIFALAAAILNP